MSSEGERDSNQGDNEENKEGKRNRFRGPDEELVNIVGGYAVRFSSVATGRPGEPEDAAPSLNPPHQPIQISTFRRGRGQQNGTRPTDANAPPWSPFRVEGYGPHRKQRIPTPPSQRAEYQTISWDAIFNPPTEEDGRTAREGSSHRRCSGNRKSGPAARRSPIQIDSQDEDEPRPAQRRRNRLNQSPHREDRRSASPPFAQTSPILRARHDHTNLRRQYQEEGDDNRFPVDPILGSRRRERIEEACRGSPRPSHPSQQPSNPVNGPPQQQSFPSLPVDTLTQDQSQSEQFRFLHGQRITNMASSLTSSASESMLLVGFRGRHATSTPLDSLLRGLENELGVPLFQSLLVDQQQFVRFANDYGDVAQRLHEARDSERRLGGRVQGLEREVSSLRDRNQRLEMQVADLRRGNEEMMDLVVFSLTGQIGRRARERQTMGGDKPMETEDDEQLEE